MRNFNLSTFVVATIMIAGTIWIVATACYNENHELPPEIQSKIYANMKMHKSKGLYDMSDEIKKKSTIHVYYNFTDIEFFE